MSNEKDRFPTYCSLLKKGGDCSTQQTFVEQTGIKSKWGG